MIFTGAPSLERLEAAHDEQLAGGEALRDLDAALGRVHPERDALDVRDVARVDDVDDVALLGRLHRERRDDDALARVADGDVHVAERARAQPVLVLRCRRSAPSPGRGASSGRRQSATRMIFAVYVRALSRERDVRGHPRLEARRVLLGDLEAQEQRVALEERREHGAGLQVLPGLHGARLDDARERARARRRRAG